MQKEEIQNEPGFMTQRVNRLGFLKYSGAAIATTGFLLAGVGCKKDDDNTPVTTKVDLGTGDIGVLNYAYALEQLEAAFYTQVIATPFTGITASESAILIDIHKHELIHRDFLKAALGTSAIIGLTPKFTAIDFTNRASVLGTAKAFEDLGVSAYNGAGKLITDANYLLLAGKIVSVEARHAAAIRDLINPNSADFAGDDVVLGLGLDIARTPAEVLAIAGAYITNTLDASRLPTS